MNFDDIIHYRGNPELTPSEEARLQVITTQLVPASEIFAIGNRNVLAEVERRKFTQASSALGQDLGKTIRNQVETGISSLGGLGSGVVAGATGQSENGAPAGINWSGLLPIAAILGGVYLLGKLLSGKHR